MIWEGKIVKNMCLKMELIWGQILLCSSRFSPAFEDPLLLPPPPSPSRTPFCFTLTPELSSLGVLQASLGDHFPPKQFALLRGNCGETCSEHATGIHAVFDLSVPFSSKERFPEHMTPNNSPLTNHQNILSLKRRMIESGLLPCFLFTSGACQ